MTILLTLLAVAGASPSCEDSADSAFIQKHAVFDDFEYKPPSSTLLPEARQSTPPSPVKVKLPDCQVDLRPSLPACMQYTPEACWATAVAQLAGYFDPSHNPESQDFERLGTSGLDIHLQRAQSCLGMECRVLGNIIAPNIMDACCTDEVEPARSSSQCQQAGYPEWILKGIQWTSGQDYILWNKPLTEFQLIQALLRGHPMPFSVRWTNGGGGHTMIIGGCGGKGTYYVHDSLSNLTIAPPWLELTWEEIFHYSPYGQVDLSQLWFQKKGEWPTAAVLKAYLNKTHNFGQRDATYILRKDVCDIVEILDPEQYSKFCAIVKQ